MRLVVLVLSGRLVIHRPTPLYVMLSMADTDGLSVHHAGDA